MKETQTQRDIRPGGDAYGSIKRARCPYCHKEMVPLFFEHEDDSGWTLAWSCACLAVRLIEEQRK